MTRTSVVPAKRINTPAQVLFASLIGTTIEFFDFYIYANAAVLVFPTLFFPTSDPASARLQSFATFAIAFLARPIGSALFGHFGDRIGRKTTLVAALLTMGVSTVTIGLLPTYAAIGIAASFAATRLLSTILFGVSPLDPVTYGGVAGVLTVAAALASYIPARRATGIAPVEALRAE